MIVHKRGLKFLYCIEKLCYTGIYWQCRMEVFLMNTVVTTKKGKIRGVEMDGYVLFKGVTYAKPPIGELRWKAPQEAEAWDGTYAADQFSCKPEQGGQEDGSFYQKEFYENP